MWVYLWKLVCHIIKLGDCDLQYMLTFDPDFVKENGFRTISHLLIKEYTLSVRFLIVQLSVEPRKNLTPQVEISYHHDRERFY